MNVLSRAFKRACPGKIAVGLMGVVAAVFCNGPIARFIDFPASHEPSRSIVVVTGCDSGFGKYMALKLASLGYVVVSTCMTQEGAKDIEAKVAEVLVCDLTLEESISRLGVAVHKLLAVNEQLSLWAVVNNAGVAPVGFVDWVSMDSFRFSMEVNYFALVAVCKEFLPLLKASKGSRIINLGSMAGLATCPAMSSYAASKHAVEGFAKSLRAELRPFGVGVCNVNPGFMQTPLISNSVSAAEKTFREAVKNDEALGRLYVGVRSTLAIIIYIHIHSLVSLHAFHTNPNLLHRYNLFVGITHKPITLHVQIHE